MTAPTFWSALVRPERPRGGGRGTWFTVLGLMLVPLVIGGLLTWALWQPTQHLDRITAAVVNDDVPVTVDGRTVPLGRQLAAGLVTSSGTTATASAGASASPSPSASATAANVSSSDSGSNLTWVITNDADAAAGLKSGAYAAAVVIPKTFSAAATSVSGDADAATQATLTLRTSDRSRPLDSLIAAAVTQTASQVLGVELTKTYVSTVLSGFTTLSSSLGQASTGADKLAAGSTSLTSGASKLADGTGTLATGLDQLAGGTGALTTGIGKLSTGAGTLASGLATLATNVQASAATAAADAPKAQDFADKLSALAAGVNGTPGLAASTQALTQKTGTTFDDSKKLLAEVGALQDKLKKMSAAVEACQETPSPPACQTLPGLLEDATTASKTALDLGTTVATDAGTADGYAQGVDGSVTRLTVATTELAAGGQSLADGIGESATGLSALAGYLQQSADGAAQLASGAQSATAGAGKLASGAASAASGATQLQTGAKGLSDGLGQFGTGTTSLATGLAQATAKIPSYTSAQASHLAAVVSDPVTTSGTSTSTDVFGPRIVPYLVVLALWLGGLATFLVLTPMTPRALASTRPSWALALRSFAPAAAIGALQGLALTAAMAGALDLSPAGWARFAGLAALTGVTFAAVNQGLAALLHGIGRFLAVLVATVGLGAAVISTIPAWVGSVYAGTPLQPGLQALQAVTSGGSIAAPTALLVVWGLGGLALTTVALARHRVVAAGTLARWARAA